MDRSREHGAIHTLGREHMVKQRDWKKRGGIQSSQLKLWGNLIILTASLLMCVLSVDVYLVFNFINFSEVLKYC